MVGNQKEDGHHCLFLWKSKDGIEFTGRKQIYDFKHDTQNVLVPRGKRMRLYSRLTQEHFLNRRVTLAEFTLDGEQIGETEIMAGDCLYNSAACKVDKRYLEDIDKMNRAKKIKNLTILINDINIEGKHYGYGAYGSYGYGGYGNYGYGYGYGYGSYDDDDKKA